MLCVQIARASYGRVGIVLLRGRICNLLRSWRNEREVDEKLSSVLEV